MSSAERSVLFSGDDFQYPSSFSLEKHRQFERYDRVFERGGGAHPFIEYRDNKDALISPRDALMRYAKTPAGMWHADQRARYPSLHAEINPQTVDIQPDDQESLFTFQQKMLGLIAHNQAENYSAHRYNHQGFDFHPLGHMAQVAMNIDRLLLNGNLAGSLVPDPFLLQVTRHVSALHDVGEAEFPGIVLHHGNSVGDIGANVGKTSANRLLERAIASHLINATFDDVYSLDLRQAVVAMASHDMTNFDQQGRIYHAVAEAGHELNSLGTATYVANRGEEIAELSPAHANILTALSFDSLQRGVRKRDHLIDEGLSPEFARLITTKLQNLFQTATARDEDSAYSDWRKLDLVVDEFGVYEPNSRNLARSLAM